MFEQVFMYIHFKKGHRLLYLPRKNNSRTTTLCKNITELFDIPMKSTQKMTTLLKAVLSQNDVLTI